MTTSFHVFLIPVWECVASPKRQQKPLWCAVPSVKKIDSFSHSLGRFLPVSLSILTMFERPLLVKAAVRLAPPISAQLPHFSG
jgi:hypothetical protein